jgi:CheY-like chemotaxis protein
VGRELTVVGSLASAKAVLAQRAFDAVLLDYDLDDGKGVELVDAIRQLPAGPVVIAASAHEEGNKLLLAAGADAACPKGSFAEVNAVLERALAARGQAEPGATAGGTG